MKTTVAQRRFDDWIALQGVRIKAARPRPVYWTCARLAHDRAKEGPVKLSAADIDLCQQRALSNERAKRFGRVPPNEAAWQAPINRVLADWQSQPAD